MSKTTGRNSKIVPVRREHRVVPLLCERDRIDGSSYPIHAILGGFRELDGYIEDEFRDELRSSIEALNCNVDFIRDSIRNHFKLTNKFKDHFPHLISMPAGEFFDWVVEVAKEKIRYYIPRFTAVVKNEFRYHKNANSTFIKNMVGLCRIRLIPLIIGIMSNENPSELSLISKIPHIKDNFDLSLPDLYNSVSYEWVKFGTMYPNSGPSAVGPFKVVTIDGRSYNAYYDYMHTGANPDFIIYNSFPGVHTVWIDGKSYITYYHVETPYSRTSIPHFRLSRISGRINVGGVDFDFPTVFLPPIKYLYKTGHTVLDAIICPPEVLCHLPYGDSVRQLVCDILNLKRDVFPPVGGSFGDHIHNRMRLFRSEDKGDRFEVCYEAKLRMRASPTEYQEAYKLYTSL